ncbi:hypothetical protein JIN77_14480 [Verrucomicrobiaceae bacterium R5-34]|uniref:Uncharacterized protein n=1 Tax=Oceaniferula flava TaxID=2800421 RepID=A0AAE2SCF3_9BACT|nr:hypothetical protein [Oceaniferula flavus]MBK1831939.1 hypothetical protein [Verrucomicrobiaceae bacterium R5-34]MBK1855293.1 hypothetical protein [Oceaniferula flavus]MBM1136599.1 hypothetical protein [Oceaniferula flavus]
MSDNPYAPPSSQQELPPDPDPEGLELYAKLNRFRMWCFTAGFVFFGLGIVVAVVRDPHSGMITGMLVVAGTAAIATGLLFSAVCLVWGFVIGYREGRRS